MPLERVAPDLPLEVVDPAGQSRFHLTTRATFDDGRSAFSDASGWAFEARLNVRLQPGLALSGVLPFGLVVPGPGQANKFFIGNFGLGVAGGWRIPLGEGGAGPGPKLFLGGGFEAYAPTVPKPDEDLATTAAEAFVARLRSYEPHLFLPDNVWLRARASIGFQISRFSAEVEGGLIPGIPTKKGGDFGMFFAMAGRIRVVALDEVEPFLELGAALPVTGFDDGTPFLLTPGLRFHVANAFDPALFASFSFTDGPAGIIFGVDLAGAVRSSRGDMTNTKEVDDFLGDD